MTTENSWLAHVARYATMLPGIQAFMAVLQFPDVTVVADTGMMSEANQKAILGY